MDAAVRVRMPAQAAVLAAGQLEITVQDLHIAVQLGDIGHLALCQRAFAVGQQPVFKLHHRLPVQAVTVAVAAVIILILLRVAQQGQMIAPPQYMVQRFHGAGFPDMHPQLLAVCHLLQKIHRRVGSVGGVGQHHPQFRTAALPAAGIQIQPVHLVQHPLCLPDKMPSLFGGDHAGGRALKDADAVFLFQILERLAHIGLGRIQLLCRRAHGAPLADGHQITQFRNIHVTAPCSKNHSYFIKPGGRLSSQMRLTRPAQSFIIKMLYLQKGV